MASYVRFNASAEHFAEGVHNLQSHDIKLYLSNTAPDSAADVAKADLAEISTGNGYSGPQTLTNKTSSQTAGDYKLVADSITITASGGSIGPFRYVVLFNDTPTSPVADPLLGYWDNGSEITLEATESVVLTISAGNGILQINTP